MILLLGTKLHRIVVKLAVEIMESSQWTEVRTFNLRDELFWFGNPRLLLRLIQFVSFQVAQHMLFRGLDLDLKEKKQYRSHSSPILLYVFAECIRNDNVYMVTSKTSPIQSDLLVSDKQVYNVDI